MEEKILTIQDLNNEIERFFDDLKTKEILQKFLKEITEHFYRISDLDKDEFINDDKPMLNKHETSFNAKMYNIQDFMDGLSSYYDMFWENLENGNKI